MTPTALLLFLVLFQAAGAPQTVPPTAAPGNPTAVISTSLGDITVELYKDRAPASVENFLQYAAENFYAGTVFHRVIPGFMIQGGGFTSELVEKPTHPPIRNEATNKLSHIRGTLGMARTEALRKQVDRLVFDQTIRGAGHNDIYARSDFQAAMREALQAVTASKDKKK